MKLKQIYKLFENLKQNPNISYGLIGKSTLGYDIPFFHIGNMDGEQIFVESAIHAREYVSCLVAIKQIEFLADKTNVGIYFVPLVNPDGVGLVLEGVKNPKLDDEQKLFVLNVNKSKDFSLWKANVNAVDLNVHFDALWGKGKHNVFDFAPANYVGKAPNTEIESCLLLEFAKSVSPVISLSYHTKGEVIFWGFEKMTPKQMKRDKQIAKQLCKYNGYKLVKTIGSTGGFSDYMSVLGVPAFTVEFGSDKLTHPISPEFAERFFVQNKWLPLVAFHGIKSFSPL